MAWCYLIHFDSPPRGKQRHYLGYTSNLAQRWGDHQAGHGSDLTKLAAKQGARMTLARVWPNGSRDLEIKLKQSGHFERNCAVCMMNAIAEALTVGEFGREVNVRVGAKINRRPDMYNPDNE